MSLLAVLALACSPDVVAEGEESPVVVRLFLADGQRGGGGVMVVQTEFDGDGDVQVPEPVASGLTFDVDGPATLEVMGQRQVVTQRYIFRGPSGHYEVPPLLATWTEGEVTETAQSTPLFLDIEVDPLRTEEIGDIIVPPEIHRPPWVPIFTVAGMFVVGIGVAFWPRPKAVQVGPPLPPHLATLAAWDLVREDPTLSDEDKSRQLSILFRGYAEAVLGFEASAWTTSEILTHLEGLAALPPGNVARARRLLRATDRIKFAEEASSGERIEELDSDLRAFVDATRPTSWQVEDKEPPAPWVRLPLWVTGATVILGGIAVGAVEAFFMAVGGGSTPWPVQYGLIALVIGAAAISRLRWPQ